MRIDCGPGYRVYIRKIGHRVVIILAGCDKNTQPNDIKKERSAIGANS
jgi:putative addiction module killer protein